MDRVLTVEQRIKDILVRELEIDPSLMDGVDSNTPLLGRGIGLDSMETLTLVTGLEQEFGIQVDDDELTTALFHTLGTLAEFVGGKLGAS
ncbi:MAG: acyl carrier protein [bacterium]